MASIPGLHNGLKIPAQSRRRRSRRTGREMIGKEKTA
jgi:hypothetical protein